LLGMLFARWGNAVLLRYISYRQAKRYSSISR